MNVFCKFTHRSLKENRMRTIVTIIGIILSMALFTAVIEGAYSGRSFMIRAQEERYGSYHAYYYQLNEKEALEGIKKAIDSIVDDQNDEL